MNNFYASYKRIFNVLKTISEKENFIRQIRQPRLSNLELIAINLTAEYKGINSESQLFRDLPVLLSSKIERSVYNKRRGKLFFPISEIQKKLSFKFNEFEEYFVVDSMPLEIVKNSRSSRCNICNEHYETAPNRGFCASQNMNYYEYKLHAVCSVQGVFKSFDISKASAHDINYLKDIKTQLSDCVVIADKGHLSHPMQLDLFETLFPQLCDQFIIRKNYAKSF